MSDPPLHPSQKLSKVVYLVPFLPIAQESSAHYKTGYALEIFLAHKSFDLFYGEIAPQYLMLDGLIKWTIMIDYVSMSHKFVTTCRSFAPIGDAWCLWRRIAISWNLSDQNEEQFSSTKEMRNLKLSLKTNDLTVFNEKEPRENDKCMDMSSRKNGDAAGQKEKLSADEEKKPSFRDRVKKLQSNKKNVVIVILCIVLIILFIVIIALAVQLGAKAPVVMPYCHTSKCLAVAAVFKDGLDESIDHVVYRFIANFLEKSNLKVNFSHKYSRIIFCFINNIVRYKAASSVLQAKDIIQMVIDEVEETNQLVESCRIYLSSELFITELECLAYFNHFVTFPFLNCVQISSQCQLLELLPKLHNNMIKGIIDTLQNYIVSIHSMPTPTLSNNLSTKIIEMMFATAASAVKLQCGREYGFSDVKLRAADLSLLSEKDLEGLPTNNLVAERDFSRFDREARVAKSRNRRFKAKNIQNNMVLYKCSKEIKIYKLSRTLAAILSCREAQWNVLQHEKLKTRLEAKLNKSKKSEDYTKKLLQNCKSWGGPCTSLEELQQILKEKSDQNIQIIKIELAYYAHTHKADKIILTDLPTNEDVIATLEERPCQHQISEPTPLNLNELCAVIWQNCDASYEWYIGYVKSIINNGYIVDHLHRVVPGCHIKWKYPSTEDVQTAELEQIALISSIKSSYECLTIFLINESLQNRHIYDVITNSDGIETDRALVRKGRLKDTVYDKPYALSGL
ncbi:hypothetical protein GQR58_028234 [Nymphon striatum]|nr:hypothetical protein GQR58_028234 [Nymphon striatum]